MIGVHCMAQHTSSFIQTFLILPMVDHLETIMQSLYEHFSSSPKRHLELTKLRGFMETKCLKILNNIKTLDFYVKPIQMNVTQI
jgi:hypothetical protein